LQAKHRNSSLIKVQLNQNYFIWDLLLRKIKRSEGITTTI
jgi:hypothetical protein